MIHSAAGKDYTAISHDFTYAPGADLTCFAYDALMDSVYEEKEDYFLQFVSSDPSVIINQDGRLSVFILDNTSMFVMFYEHNYTDLIGLRFILNKEPFYYH